jgi:mRNA-degrading endonuclease YafQ of YafQ-DinJ toxin-antitoxin module
MIQYAPINDITMTDEFSSDYDRAPVAVQKKLNKLVDLILEGHTLPNSLQPHQTYQDDLWIGYVNRDGQHWRLLFWYDEETETVIMHRLMTHERMNRYLD